jgi:hypothetical protein
MSLVNTEMSSNEQEVFFEQEVSGNKRKRSTEENVPAKRSKNVETDFLGNDFSDLSKLSQDEKDRFFVILSILLKKFGSYMNTLLVIGLNEYAEYIKKRSWLPYYKSGSFNTDDFGELCAIFRSILYMNNGEYQGKFFIQVLPKCSSFFEKENTDFLKWFFGFFGFLNLRTACIIPMVRKLILKDNGEGLCWLTYQYKLRHYLSHLVPHPDEKNRHKNRKFLNLALDVESKEVLKFFGSAGIFDNVDIECHRAYLTRDILDMFEPFGWATKPALIKK